MLRCQPVPPSDVGHTQIQKLSGKIITVLVANNNYDLPGHDFRFSCFNERNFLCIFLCSINKFIRTLTGSS